MVKERWRAIEKSPDFSFTPRLRNPPSESRQAAAPWGFAQILQRFSIVVPGERGQRGPVRSFRERKTPPPHRAPGDSRSSLGSLHLRVGDQRPPALGCVPTFCSLGWVASTAPGNPAQPGSGVCAWLRKTRPPRVWAREQTRDRELHAKRLFLDTQGLEPKVITPSVC